VLDSILALVIAPVIEPVIARWLRDDRLAFYSRRRSEPAAHQCAADGCG
jgi:hypothetical protein